MCWIPPQPPPWGHWGFISEAGAILVFPLTFDIQIWVSAHEFLVASWLLGTAWQKLLTLLFHAAELLPATRRFSQSGWKAFHTGWAIICAVFCHWVSVLLSQADLIEFLRTAGKDVNLGKFWVSYLRCCDYGIDTFYFVVLFLFF